MEKEKSSQLFYTIIYTFQMQTMVHLGKIANPATNKVERELDSAAMSIDIIEMLEDKTKGNLSEEESKYIQTVLTDLRLNYASEKNKPEEPEKKDSPEENK